MRLPVYITTNYDSLLEEAWRSEWNEEIRVVTNDLDILELKLDNATELPLRVLDTKKKETRPSILIKLHGDAKSESNHLILARSDYRRHYRSNPELFRLVQRLMLSGVTFFVGFSHRDPEASRLVEDVVYEYEVRGGAHPPTLYSLQFDMRLRTPEVFAARGIVALRPTTVLTAGTPAEARSVAVAIELAELSVAADGDDHECVDLAKDIEAAADAIATTVKSSLDLLAARKGQIESDLSDRTAVEAHLAKLVTELGSVAGQGVYVTLANGDIAGVAAPDGLRADLRNARKNFADRPYFRQAKTFRTQFVSDVMPSIYNGHGTVFFCVPLGDQQSFGGLLFAACQPGAWELPVTLRDQLAPRDIEFVLVDSNGIAIVPSLAALRAQDSKSHPAGEKDEKNMGFPFTSLRDYSQRDRHVAHITENIVPVGIDDDIHEVSSDLHLFSMVASVRHTRWKLALSRYVPSRPKT
ncbi:MAG TPA: SIR2 family protein [Thermoanaerobaculia bacterium]